MSSHRRVPLNNTEPTQLYMVALLLFKCEVYVNVKFNQMWDLINLTKYVIEAKQKSTPTLWISNPERGQARFAPLLLS